MRTDNEAVDTERRFGGLKRLYGDDALSRFADVSVCVVGIGGVGSWTAEALVRSGVTRLTLIDLDHVAESNFNRQIHALESTLGQAKIEAMANRLKEINPVAGITLVDDFLTPENCDRLLAAAELVIDAIDSVRAKVAIAAHCRKNEQPLVMAGGAGGKTDPARIRVADLSQTIQDPLLSKVRADLRRHHDFPRGDKKFGIPAIFSTEPVRYPVTGCAPSGPLQGLACAGYGSCMPVTASFGLFAASLALDLMLKRTAS